MLNAIHNPVTEMLEAIDAFELANDVLGRHGTNAAQAVRIITAQQQRKANKLTLRQAQRGLNIYNGVEVSTEN